MSLLKSFKIQSWLLNQWKTHNTTNSFCTAEGSWVSYLWKSKTQPLICDKHRPRKNLQEKGCSSHQTQAKRFLWPWARKLLQALLYSEPCSLWMEKKDILSKASQPETLLPFICKVESEVSFIIMWHPKCCSSTWPFLNIICTHDNLQFLRMFLSPLQATANPSYLNLDS